MDQAKSFKDTTLIEATELVVQVLLPNQSQEATFLTHVSMQNHPPWVFKAFKELHVQKRKELIGNTVIVTVV